MISLNGCTPALALPTIAQTSSSIQLAVTWRCSQCSEFFDTKGKRDTHNKGVHSLITSVRYADGTKHVVSRVDGEFACRCGNKYKHSDSLVRHAKECKKQASLLKLLPHEGALGESETIGMSIKYVSQTNKH
jgi:hypothetical protein